MYKILLGHVSLHFSVLARLTSQRSNFYDLVKFCRSDKFRLKAALRRADKGLFQRNAATFPKFKSKQPKCSWRKRKCQIKHLLEVNCEILGFLLS